MRSLTAAELLDVWEAGQGLSLPARAVTLLAAASPDLGWDGAVGLPIGERDRRLLTLREWLFGATVASVVACPRCGERLELSFAVRDIQAPALTDGADYHLTVDGYAVEFRLPTSRDLLRVADLDAETAAHHILMACVTASRDGQPVAADNLPAIAEEAIAARMAAADPQADARLALTCAACGHAWDVVFDITSFLWQEIETWAQRTLIEIHLLARAYGWTEGEILALSARRRRLYLELVQR